MKKKLYMLQVLSVFVFTLISLSCTTRPSALFVDFIIVDENMQLITGEREKQLTFETTREFHYSRNPNNPKRGAIKGRKHNLPVRDMRLSLAKHSSELFKHKNLKLYEKALQRTGIKITDTLGEYEDFVLDPLPLKGYKVLDTKDGYPSRIEYTVQLKKK